MLQGGGSSRGMSVPGGRVSRGMGIPVTRVSYQKTYISCPYYISYYL